MDRAAADADVAVGEVQDARRGGLADHLAALGVRAAVRAADVEHPAVGRGRDAVRLTAVGQVAAGGVDHARGRVVGQDRGLAAAADEARGPLDRAQQVLLEVGLAVAGGRAAEAGVEGAAARVVAAPGDRPVGATRGGAVAGRRVGRVVARDGVDRAGRARGPAVVDVAARPLQRQVASGGMHAVAEDDDLVGGGGRARRVGARADQAVDERVARLGLSRRADADEAAAGLDVALEGGLLRGVEAVARVVEEHDGAVGREVGRAEDARVRRRSRPRSRSPCRAP